MSITTKLKPDYSHVKYLFVIEGLTTENTEGKLELYKSAGFYGGIDFKFIEWYFKFVPCFNGFTRIFLTTAEEIDPTLQISMKFAIVDKNGDHKCKQEIVLKAGTIKKSNVFPELVSRDDLFDPELKLLKNNQLEIFCELRFQYNGEQETILTKQLAHILSNDFSDITLVVGDHKIQSHKLVLAEASEVFYNTLKESTKVDELCINDVEPDVMDQVVKFLCTSQVDNREITNIQKLILVAEKFKILRLKSICEKVLLAASKKEENCNDILLFANENNLSDLEFFVIEHISRDLQLLNGFDMCFIEQHPKVVNEIFKKFIKHQNIGESQAEKSVSAENKVYLKESYCSTVAFDEKLFGDMKYSDITFQLDGKSVEAHRNILASRSEVFAAMFAFDSKEKVINITDSNPCAFREFIRYIYCEKVLQLECHSLELLRLSDKYDMPNLKNVCVEYLLDHIDAENVLDIWTISSLCEIQSLEIKAYEYMKRYINVVVQNENWNDFIEKNCKLLHNILITLVQKCKDRQLIDTIAKHLYQSMGRAKR